jgi:hypothetical protein
VTIYSVDFCPDAPNPALLYCAGTQPGVSDPKYFRQPGDTTALGQALTEVGQDILKVRITQ